MKKILVINTGGTISMSEDHTTGKVSPNKDNLKLLKKKC